MTEKEGLFYKKLLETYREVSKIYYIHIEKIIVTNLVKGLWRVDYSEKPHLIIGKEEWQEAERQIVELDLENEDKRPHELSMYRLPNTAAWRGIPVIEDDDLAREILQDVLNRMRDA